MNPKEVLKCIEEMIYKYGHFPQNEDIAVEYGCDVSLDAYETAEDMWFASKA